MCLDCLISWKVPSRAGSLTDSLTRLGFTTVRVRRLRKESVMNRNRFLVIVIVLLSLAAGIFGMVNSMMTSSQLAQAKRQLSTQQQQMSQQVDQQIEIQQQRITNLNSEVSGLNVPTDPLANYNQVCSNPDVENDSTGQTQTYWYPCTNNAQTIPQPGS